MSKYPCLEIDLNKISYNVKKIKDICRDKGISTAFVTKVFCGDETIIKEIVNSGADTLGESRIDNFRRLKKLHFKKLLVRIPMISEVEEVVEYCDISLNSELKVIQALSREAENRSKKHSIILMVDLGDLREGVLPKDAIEIVKEILELKGIELLGIGTNLTCYGGVIPDENNMGRLLEIKNNIEESLNINIPLVSGGNSSSLYMVEGGNIPKGINHLRIGEGFILGRETAFGKDIDHLHKDVFTLKGEIIEIKEKPSIPEGKIGLDAFGNKPEFEDKGFMKRAIVALGKQDILLEGIYPRDKKIEILGASSDHLILNITSCGNKYSVGDIVEFDVNYGCLLSVMTSSYIEKRYIK